MIFDENWTKEDNNLLRKLNKEGKSFEEKVNIMGLDKLKQHPKKKYIFDFSDYVLNEIKLHAKQTSYNIIPKKSTFPNEIDYEVSFVTNSNTEYILDFIMYYDTVSVFKNKRLC